jgi:hypothetical protein
MTLSLTLNRLGEAIKHVGEQSYWSLPLWTMKTSWSRTDVLISTLVSPFANFFSSTLAGWSPMRLHIASTRAGWLEPLPSVKVSTWRFRGIQSSRGQPYLKTHAFLPILQSYRRRVRKALLVESSPRGILRKRGVARCSLLSCST